MCSTCILLTLGAIGSITALVFVLKWDNSNPDESWKTYVTRNIKKK